MFFVVYVYLMNFPANICKFENMYIYYTIDDLCVAKMNLLLLFKRVVT